MPPCCHPARCCPRLGSARTPRASGWPARRRQAAGSHRSARTGWVAGDGQPARLALRGGSGTHSRCQRPWRRVVCVRSGIPMTRICQHALPRFPFHCYTNPFNKVIHALCMRVERTFVWEDEFQAAAATVRAHPAAALWHEGDGIHADQSARVLRYLKPQPVNLIYVSSIPSPKSVIW